MQTNGEMIPNNNKDNSSGGPPPHGGENTAALSLSLEEPPNFVSYERTLPHLPGHHHHAQSEDTSLREKLKYDLYSLSTRQKWTEDAEVKRNNLLLRKDIHLSNIIFYSQKNSCWFVCSFVSLN